MTDKPTDDARTRHRLLEAAGEVFAEQGFRHATVRDICARAGANVAAINYHFGDKESLYGEVLKYAHRSMTVWAPPRSDARPAERLRQFVRSFVIQLFDEGKAAWRMKLMVREMIEPTWALDRIVEEDIRPRSELLQSIVSDILGEGASPREVALCVLSIISQCVFYRNSRPVMERLRPEMKYRPQDVERVAEHIVRFSLAALKHLPAVKEERR